MKFLTTLVFTFFTLFLSAQTDIFEIYAALNETKKLPTDIKKITEYEYGMFTMEEDAKPDTILNFNGKDNELFLNTKMETIYESSEKYKEISYDESGESTMTSTYILDKEGRALSWETDLGDGPAAAFMNSKKEYYYGEGGRISSVFNNGQEQLTIKYDENGNFEEILMDMGMAKMKVTTSQADEKIRYDMSLDMGTLPEGIPEMMLKGLKDSPKAYIEQNTGKNQNTFVGFEENKETGNFEKRWETIRDLDYKLLSKKEFSPEGEITSHNEFSYTDSGEIKSSKNIIEGTELINEFDESGNIKIEREAFAERHYKYDKLGNLLQKFTTSGTGEDASIIGVTIRKIEFK